MNLQLFFTPAFVALSIAFSAFFQYYLQLPLWFVNTLLLTGICVGSAELVFETIKSLLRKQFALDYIALLAISLGVINGNYYVAIVIVLMLAGGTTLEKYAIKKAQKSLTALKERIPDTVLLWKNGKIAEPVNISSIKINTSIVVRKGEVIPLDGILTSEKALIDESSLTGEAVPVEKISGDTLHSGTINLGNLVVLCVTKEEKNSTYHKIVEMVEQAQTEKAPLVRLADKYSTIFTIITFIIATFAYIISDGNITRVLAVLVIATPCPLILATPIALISGMNAAAKKHIIIKNLGVIEVLSRIRAIILDKTGTVTLGKPVVSQVNILDKKYSEKDILMIAAALERHSLHPLAKALIAEAEERQIPHLAATDVEESIGSGIKGIVNEHVYMLTKTPDVQNLSVSLLENEKAIAYISFEDIPKEGAAAKLLTLKKNGMELFLFTGDKQSAAQNLIRTLQLDLNLRSHMSPEDKKDGVVELRKKYGAVAMIGDGINDAPALALADVGMVFSGHEQTAATEAADIVFLGSHLGMVTDTISIGKHTIRIALQSILAGIGISILGMILASLGWIPPVVGAIMQEVLDIAVILNALRAAKA